MKEGMSPSRMNCMTACNRKHYWSYEVGIKPATDAQALRFGSAIHRALAGRAIGADYATALSLGIGEAKDLVELDVAILAALLEGYYQRYAEEIVEKMYPEVEIRTEMEGNGSFEAHTVLDGMAQLKDSRLALMEHKTTSESIEGSSPYWESLRYNTQCTFYVEAARSKDWNIETVVYDVIKKPGIAPKQTPTLDRDGKKIVRDATGTRVFKKDGSPRESADTEKGFVLLQDIETVDQFSDRLRADIAERPDYYFARKELSVLDSDIQEMQAQRDAVARQITAARLQQRRYDKPEYAWPRCVGRFTCQMCEFSGPCLQGLSCTKENPFSGFKLKNS